MTTLGIDYSSSHHPDPQVVLKAGYRFVMRYLSNTPGKNLTRAELDGYHALGIEVGVVWETTSQRPLRGRAAGLEDGAKAKGMADQLGADQNVVLYAAYDWDVQGHQLEQCDAYQAGFREACAPHPDGVYGGLLVCDHMAVRTRYRWQTIAWSHKRRHAGAVLYQRGGQVIVGGVECDVNEQLGDFGGFGAPVPTIEEAVKVLYAPIISAGVNADGSGYRLLGADFGVFCFGNCPYLGHVNDGDEAHGKTSQPPALIVNTPGGQGYWVVTHDFGLYTFGDAPFLGRPNDGVDEHGHSSSAPVAMFSTPSGQGYIVFAADGGIFTFGDAQFHGVP